MSMKSASAPRRIYVRNGITHVCFEGRFYGPGAAATSFGDEPVTLEPMPSDGGRARVKVTQKRRGKSTLVETWRSVSVPRKERA